MRGMRREGEVRQDGRERERKGGEVEWERFM